MVEKYLHNKSLNVVSTSSQTKLISETLAILAQQGISQKDILTHIQKNTTVQAIPLAVFATEMSPLRALVKHLHEHQGMRFADIARMLGRDPRTISATYAQVKNTALVLADTEALHIEIPTNIFAHPQLSLLEVICTYLQSNLKLSYRQIGILLNKNERTVWTVCARAKRK